MKLAFITQKMKFPMKNFFSKCDQIRSFIFTEEIPHGKLHFLYNALFLAWTIIWGSHHRELQ